LGSWLDLARLCFGRIRRRQLEPARGSRRRFGLATVGFSRRLAHIIADIQSTTAAGLGHDPHAAFRRQVESAAAESAAAKTTAPPPADPPPHPPPPRRPPPTPPPPTPPPPPPPSPPWSPPPPPMPPPKPKPPPCVCCGGTIGSTRSPTG